MGTLICIVVNSGPNKIHCILGQTLFVKHGNFYMAEKLGRF